LALRSRGGEGDASADSTNKVIARADEADFEERGERRGEGEEGNKPR